MRDATEMDARWMRDGCEIWRDAGLYKISQFSRTLSKSQKTLASGGFRSSTNPGLSSVSVTPVTNPRLSPQEKCENPANTALSPMSPMSPQKSGSGGEGSRLAL
jgi:hypothetical protein